jgi:hypothetical protein
LPRLNRLLAGYRLWIHLDLARNELQAMTAFEGAIHIQTRASVAPMQALAGGFTAFCRSHATAFCLVPKKAPGPGRLVPRDTPGSFTGFNRPATCGMIMERKPLMRAKRRCDGDVR